MKIWTAHEKPDAAPLLVREGFSSGALLLGPFWLAAHRLWLPAAFVLLTDVLLLVLTEPPVALVLTGAVTVLLGFSGRDLLRWSATRRGYLETGVVAARTQDEARVRLLTERPDLTARSMRAEAAA